MSSHAYTHPRVRGTFSHLKNAFFVTIILRRKYQGGVTLIMGCESNSVDKQGLMGAN